MALGAARLLGLPIDDKGLEVIAFAFPLLPAVGPKRRTDHIDRLYRQGNLVQLRPANPRYPIITINADRELLIWGVVTGSIRQFNR
jgi:hypothetical protein